MTTPLEIADSGGLSDNVIRNRENKEKNRKKNDSDPLVAESAMSNPDEVSSGGTDGAVIPPA